MMNCYFPDFWYSHVIEKRTSEGRNAICEKTGYPMEAKYANNKANTSNKNGIP